MDQSPEHNMSLFQQIGQIQGALSALDRNISDFKSEFRSMTNNQNDKIESLRKEFTVELVEVTKQSDGLKQFKATLEGSQAEAARSAKVSGSLTGGLTGVVIVGLFEIIKLLIK